MNSQRGGFIDVDKYQQQVAVSGNVLERVADFYSRSLPELHKTQRETRMACLFACGKQEPTGDRAIALREENDGCVFNCFQYGCDTRGNLLSLMWWMKHDTGPTGGRLKGTEFSEIARDLRDMVDGNSPAQNEVPAAAPTESKPVEEKVNVRLRDSENERARELVTLDERFLLNVAEMAPAASAYVRNRPYLTTEAMQKFRCGYLPSDGGSLLRSHFVYAWLDQQGDVLTWFGRNVNYEQQHRAWRQAGDSKKEPQKFKFVKGFHRGLELFGEQQARESSESGLWKKTGLILVEGPNDCMALDALGVPVVAVCSNKITERQADKLTQLAAELADGSVTVMFDLDLEGIRGAEQAVVALANRTRVRLGWTENMTEGKFQRRQPESLTEYEWENTLLPHLVQQDG